MSITVDMDYCHQPVEAFGRAFATRPVYLSYRLSTRASRSDVQYSAMPVNDQLKQSKSRSGYLKHVQTK